MARQQPERRDPPEIWLCLRYARLGPARFTSARDIARLLERATKRAGLPVAYSSGFSPHQRISYAFPAPTGAASHAEYALVGLTNVFPAEQLRDALNAQLPDGVQALAAELTDDRHLPHRLEVSAWRAEWPLFDELPGLAQAVQSFMDSPDVIIDRPAKSQTTRQDVRGAVVSMEADDGLIVVLKQAEPLIRPSDVLAGLTGFCPALPDWGRPLLTRLAQGTLDECRVANIV